MRPDAWPNRDVQTGLANHVCGPVRSNLCLVQAMRSANRLIYCIYILQAWHLYAEQAGLFFKMVNCEAYY